MLDTIREAPLGQLLRWVTKNKVLQYPEERPGFQLPQSYNTVLSKGKNGIDTRKSSATAVGDGLPRTDSSDASSLEKVDVEAVPAAGHAQNNEITRTVSKPVDPVLAEDGTILVDWYTTDDPANPQNWSNLKKTWVGFVMCLYTFVVYTGSAIYVASVSDLKSLWGLSSVDASLPLAIYVLAYGIGPLIFSPLSEIPRIGRGWVYFITFVIFTIISLPTALVNNFAGLLVLRFLQGFFGSPCLATGGATMADMVSMINTPYAIIAWVASAYGGPALGPLISGYAVESQGWRWSLWEIFWAACPTVLLMFAFFPETSSPNILLRRAARLRALTGETRLQAHSEIEQKHLTASKVLSDALIKPMEITIKDPAIAFVNIYTALVYGIFYSFFEVFPLVYPAYGFDLGMIGVLFLCVLIACLLGIAIYVVYLYFIMIPDLKSARPRPQEARLVPALFASFFPVIGLFIFAWTARADISWAVPTLGIVLYAASVFILQQCIFTYMPMSYPQYAASLFAANDFFRSALAFAAILFAHPLFGNLGVARGTSVLGGLSMLGVFGIFALWVWGADLRARSKFAQH